MPVHTGFFDRCVWGKDEHRQDAPYLLVMAELTIWYDGACPLCRREMAAMHRLDTRHAIQFVEIDCVDSGSCPLDRATLLARFHARENGELLSGAAAFAAMWRALPLLRPLGLAARIPVILRLLEIAYVGFLSVRPRLQQFARRVLPA